MERTHTPLSVWFWAAYLVTSQTPGMSAVQFQRQLGLPCYETAFQILHKLRVGMVRPDQDRIGGRPEEHVEADETYIGGRTRGKGRGVHDMVLVAGAVEVRQRKQQGSRNERRTGRYAGRVRLAVAPDRSAKSLGGFIERTVVPGTTIITDDWSGYVKLGERGYCHTAVAERGDMQVAETFLPIIHLVFSNLKTWLRGTHHGVSPQHLSAYLNEFTFRFNRRFYPFNAFRSLLGIAGDLTAPHTPISTPKNHDPLHLVGVCDNPISTVPPSRLKTYRRETSRPPVSTGVLAPWRCRPKRPGDIRCIRSGSDPPKVRKTPKVIAGDDLGAL